MSKRTKSKIICWNYLSKISIYHVTECRLCDVLRPFRNQVEIAEFFHGRFHSLSASIIQP